MIDLNVRSHTNLQVYVCQQLFLKVNIQRAPENFSRKVSKNTFSRDRVTCFDAVLNIETLAQSYETYTRQGHFFKCVRYVI